MQQAFVSSSEPLPLKDYCLHVHDHLLESPREALIPTLLVHPLGPLIEFPVSVPKPAIAKLAATPAMSSVYSEAISHSKPPLLAI